MRRLLPAFVQRRLLLSAARRALAEGRPESVLEILRDALLVGDPRAESLRLVALPLIPAPPQPPPFEPARNAGSPSGREDLRELLKHMRGERESKLEGAAMVASTAAAPLPAANAVREVSARTQARPVSLRMSIDDAGSFLLCAGDQAVVGHSRAGEADVPLLADLSPRHARFVLEPGDFHAGSSWRVEPIGDARVRIGPNLLSNAGQSLHSGELVCLGEHTALRFEQPDDASLSCTLELEAGLESAGAKRVLLFAPGAAGRLRIGARGARHVQVSLGGVELELVHNGQSLTIHCASGLVPDEAQGSPPRTEFELPLGMSRPLHLRLCMPTPSERPRWISFAPAEDA